MPLNKLSFPIAQKRFMDNWFRDIIERHTPTGDIYAMMAEVYVLGFDHCIRGTAHLKAQGKPYEYSGNGDKNG